LAVFGVPEGLAEDEGDSPGWPGGVSPLPGLVLEGSGCPVPELGLPDSVFEPGEEVPGLPEFSG
jgi:hypothetical protein